MILFVGARGTLGRATIPLLLDEGFAVRALTRRPESVRELVSAGVEVVRGDLRDPAAVRAVCDGADRVVAAAHSVFGWGRSHPARVDGDGNRRLIDAARASGVKHFIFISVAGAGPDHPLDFCRVKHATEEYLRASGLSYTILRPTAFAVPHVAMLTDSVARKGTAVLVGHGDNPRNYVVVDDVARHVVWALRSPDARGRVVEVGGPENVAARELVDRVARLAGRSVRVRHVPIPLLRTVAAAARPLPSVVRRLSLAVLLGETAPEPFDPSAPQTAPVEATPLDRFLEERYGAASPARPAS